MILRLFMRAIVLVLVLALAAGIFGSDLITTAVHHITDGIDELARLATSLSDSGQAGRVADQIQRNLP